MTGFCEFGREICGKSDGFVWNRFQFRISEIRLHPAQHGTRVRLQKILAQVHISWYNLNNYRKEACNYEQSR